MALFMLEWSFENELHVKAIIDEIAIIIIKKHKCQVDSHVSLPWKPKIIFFM